MRSELLSSPTRRRLAELMSVRPRSLRELAKSTGLTVPGVLRHLDALASVGVIREEGMTSRQLQVRKLYSLKGVKVVDLSVGDLSITEITKTTGGPGAGGKEDLEWLASDLMINRRRIREKARRLARAIEENLESETRLVRTIESMDLDPDERHIVLTAFTEETMGDSERILESEGVEDARRSIERALAKAKSIVHR